MLSQKFATGSFCQYNVYNGNISITPENTILKRKLLNFFYKQFLIKFSPLIESKVHPAMWEVCIFKKEPHISNIFVSGVVLISEVNIFLCEYNVYNINTNTLTTQVGKNILAPCFESILSPLFLRGS